MVLRVSNGVPICLLGNRDGLGYFLYLNLSLALEKEGDVDVEMGVGHIGSAGQGLGREAVELPASVVQGDRCACRKRLGEEVGVFGGGVFIVSHSHAVHVVGRLVAELRNQPVLGIEGKLVVQRNAEL